VEVTFVPLGRIVRAHALRGEVLIKPYSTPSPTLAQSENLYLPGPKPYELIIERRRETPNGFLIKFKGIDDRDAAEKLRGQEIVCHPNQLPELEDDEFYSYQLIGLKVCTSEKEIGTIKEVMSTRGQDLLVVEGDGKEFLIPAVPDILVEVDLLDGVVTIDPPEGLLETCGSKLSRSSRDASLDPSLSE